MVLKMLINKVFCLPEEAKLIEHTKFEKFNTMFGINFVFDYES
jgi:hypothetical protein